MKTIQISPEFVETLEKAVMTEWERRQSELHRDDEDIDVSIAELQGQAQAAKDKIKILSSASTIKYMEEEVDNAEAQIANLMVQKEKIESDKTVDMRRIMDYIKFFIEHLEFLLLQQMNPVAKAGYFGVLFDKAPTYAEIAGLGTPELTAPLELNRLFIQKNLSLDDLAGHRGRFTNISDMKESICKRHETGTFWE